MIDTVERDMGGLERDREREGEGERGGKRKREGGREREGEKDGREREREGKRMREGERSLVYRSDTQTNIVVFTTKLEREKERERTAGESGRKREVWYIALAHRQTLCFADC